MIRSHPGTFDLLARLADSIWIPAALWLACALYPEPWRSDHGLAAMYAIIVFHLAGQANGLYRTDRGEPLKREIVRVWATWGMVVPLVLLAAFATKTSGRYSRAIAGAWFLLAPGLLCCWRAGLRIALQEARARGYNTRRAAVAGLTTLGEQVAKQIVEAPWTGLRFAGFFDDRDVARLTPAWGDLGGVLGPFHDLVQRARRDELDVVYIALPPRADRRVRELIRSLSDTTASVYLAYDFWEFDLLRAEWSSVGDVPVLSVVENPFRGVDGWVKAVEDVVLALAILSVAAIPMLLIAAALKLASPGPVFFRQRRYGLNGEEISILKFRTMTVHEDGEDVVQVIRNDPRLTPIGEFLRRTSLDELPQFLQVLTGKMSIVGPRPHAVLHNERYRVLIQGYMRRHKVKPGITGWAQVNGFRGETDTLEKMERRVEYDLAYIRNWGLWLDLKIIFLTVIAAVRRRNAY